MWVCFGVAVLAAATAVHAWYERSVPNASLRFTFSGEPAQPMGLFHRVSVCFFFQAGVGVRCRDPCVKSFKDVNVRYPPRQ